MAISVTLRKRGGLGPQRSVTGLFTFDDSYPSGGETVTAATFGLKSIDFIQFEATTSNYAVYDRANGKVVLYARTDDTQVTGDQSAVALRYLAVGQ